MALVGDGFAMLEARRDDAGGRAAQRAQNFGCLVKLGVLRHAEGPLDGSGIPPVPPERRALDDDGEGEHGTHEQWDHHKPALGEHGDERGYVVHETLPFGPVRGTDGACGWLPKAKGFGWLAG